MLKQTIFTELERVTMTIGTTILSRTPGAVGKKFYTSGTVRHFRGFSIVSALKDFRAYANQRLINSFGTLVLPTLVFFDDMCSFPIERA